jgi:hypothetical protein
MVIKHLEAWHRRYEDIYKKKMEYQASTEYLDNLPFSSFNLSPLTEWYQVQCDSKRNRRSKSALKPSAKAALLVESGKVIHTNKRRGRPRLEHSASADLPQSTVEQRQLAVPAGDSLKRKRGRPRKFQPSIVENILRLEGKTNSRSPQQSGQSLVRNNPPTPNIRSLDLTDAFNQIPPRRLGRPRKVLRTTAI